MPSAGPSVEKREPSVAVLDVEPDSAWVQAFRIRVDLTQ